MTVGGSKRVNILCICLRVLFYILPLIFYASAEWMRLTEEEGRKVLPRSSAPTQDSQVNKKKTTHRTNFLYLAHIFLLYFSHPRQLKIGKRNMKIFLS